MKAQIIRSSAKTFDCLILESNHQIKATPVGNLLKSKNPVVGDFVEIEAVGESFSITALYPRTNEIYRVLVRDKSRKVTAANCDLMALVFSASLPQYKQGLVDRYLIRAQQWQIPTILIFNKMDEYCPEFVDPAFEAARVRPLIQGAYELSAKGEHQPRCGLQSLEELKSAIAKKTTIVVGPSGVGKSSLIERLADRTISLKSQVISRKHLKGQHTTTWCEIINYNHFKIIDSPGIRSFAVHDIEREELILYFPDLAALFSRCQYTNCTHLPSSHGCSFAPLYTSDALTQEETFIFSRLLSYLQILDEISSIPEWEK